MKTILRILSAGLSACAFSLVLTASTEPGILWEIKILEAPRMNLNDVAHNGSGRMIAVGDVGTIRVSDNHGASWVTKDSDVSLDLEAVAWTGSRWVAVGGFSTETCMILNSVDGEEWSTTCLLGMPGLNGVAANPTTTVVVGENNMTAHSTNLVAWSASSGGSYDFADAVWTGVRFVAVGDHGLVKTSPDGVTWTPRTNGLTADMYLNSVTWTGSNVVAAGVDWSTGKPLILTSPEGIDWTAPSMAGFPDFHLEAIAWTGSSLVAMGDAGHTLTSPDGAAWSHYQIAGNIYVRGLCWDGSHLVAVGYGGTVIETMESAPDEPSDWAILSPENLAPFLTDIATGEVSAVNRAVVVGGWSTVLTSDNEFNSFTTQTSGTSDHLNGITATTLPATRFIAVGGRGAIITSPDAVTWTTKTSGTTNDLYAVDWFKPIGLGGTTFAVAAGFDGTILTSTNTTTWFPQSTPTTQALRNIAVGSVFVKPDVTRRIVAVGSSGTIIYSSDGVTWHTASDPGTSHNLNGVAAREYGFVAVGDNGLILTSANGIDWTTRTSGTSARLYGVTWTGSQIVVTGTNGVVLTSPDSGINWTRRYRPGSMAWNAVAALDSGRLAAVGTYGMIATSDPAMDFADWITAESPPSGQDGPDDDPNGDGITNLLAYGLGIPAVAPTDAEDFATLPRLVQPGPGRPMIVRIRPANSPLGDIAYIAETSTTLEPGAWTEVLRHLPGQPCGTGSVELMMSGSSDYVFLIFPESIGDRDRYFTRLRIEQTP